MVRIGTITGEAFSRRGIGWIVCSESVVARSARRDVTYALVIHDNLAGG
jgi:hypothetical protein